MEFFTFGMLMMASMFRFSALARSFSILKLETRKDRTFLRLIKNPRPRSIIMSSISIGSSGATDHPLPNLPEND